MNKNTTVTQSAKRVRWAPTAMAYDAPVVPKTPSPTRSDSSLPDSSGPYTPPSLHYNTPLPDITQIAIHPFLAYHMHTSPSTLLYDVTLRPEHALLNATRRTQLLPADRAQPATIPSVSHMEILIPSLSCWRPIQLAAHDLRLGVTIGEVIDAIYHYMRLSVTKGEFEFFPAAAQRKISIAFQNRCDRSNGSAESRAAEMQKGLRRVDCLAGHTLFQGLTQAGKSPHLWQLQLSPMHT